MTDTLDAASLGPEATYRLLSGIVVPRPIAWISTLSETGVVNLAPFSCFTFVSNKPPLLGVNIGRKAGRRKDTATHILARREYVVNIGHGGQLQQIHESSAEHPPEVSEAELLGLATAPCEAVAVPRIADAGVAMECRLSQVIPFGDTGAEFFVGAVLRFHVREGLLRDGKIDTLALDPVCRIGGPNYATLGRVLTLRTMPQTAKTVTTVP
ncbi:flavin reductase family protein [Acidovorax sp. NCPPB 3859]|nr:MULTISPECIES: flavin reductase family protein [unclassified Acidovorax]MDA8451527.1 flavin reductase family protein [Acidovorax sp. GBBC 3297]MDA8460973.1 flavin reductase family protein [Acidovorax sp. GBBC 3333]MDA8465898.1 flavin reductase family protein [Acidovorax sp. GBBC 3332]MDA8471043.1 flavin reductase family protein [Acidovorax sp. GBBC 3299]WCM78114.1 flavin reductase family protein [Acidovorax sp. GBBC 712]